MNSLSLDDIRTLTGNRLGKHDVACPFCGPGRKAAHNRKRKVMRIWWKESDFASYNCERCDAKGYSRRADYTPRFDPIRRMQQRVAPKPAALVPEATDAERTAKALAIWNEAGPIAGTLAEQYFANRSLQIFDGAADLRFHPRCKFGLERLPCLVALFRDIETDEPKAIHRIALTQEAKAIHKMMYGPVKGCAIKLSPDDAIRDTLAIAEGIETALAAAQLKYRPIWALASAGGVRDFPVLKPVKCLAIMVDNDASGTGRAVAMECSQRWLKARREVFRFMPKREGQDMADIVREAA